MTRSDFWDKTLEPDENLLWTGRPKPRFHWRNWRLYGSAPMAATGLLAAAWVIIFTSGSEGDMWLLILPALLVFIPARATWQQLQTLAATRYALTDQRALMFFVGPEGTRVRAYPKTAMIAPQPQPTEPPSVSFLRDDTNKKRLLGFDYVDSAPELTKQLERMTR